MSDSTPSTDATAAGGEIGLVGRLIGIFTSPGATFASVNQKAGHTDWLVPLLISAIVASVSIHFIMPVLQEFNEQTMRAQMEGNENMTPEGREQAIEMSRKFGGVAAKVVAPIGIAFYALVQALLLWGLANLALGGSATFRKTFTVIAYSSLITSAGGLINIPLILAKGTPKVALGLNLLLPASMANSFLSNFLGVANIFAIWQVAVVSIGAAVVAGIPTKKAAMGVVALFVIVSAGMAVVAGMAPGMGS